MKIEDKPKKEKRFISKNFLVTVSDLEEEECNLEKLRDKSMLNEQNYDSITISKEKHGSGKFHIHALFSFKGRREYVRSHFDYLRNKRGNISVDRQYSSLSSALKYVTKDKEYISTDSHILDKIRITSLKELFSLESREEVLDKMRSEEKWLGRSESLLRSYEIIKENERVISERKKPYFPVIFVENLKNF